MATYPSSLYSHTTLVDGSDYPLATHINTPAAEVVAIETELGTNPRSIDDTVTPGSSPTSVANYLDMVANLLKRVSNSANWYAPAVNKVRGTVATPNSYYTAVRAQIPLFRADAALTITRIHIHGADTSPTTEMAGDLKFADDLNTGGFASATVIDVCDTTNGVFTATSSFDDATVPSGKYVYFQMDSAPHADWKDFYIEVYYTYD